MKVSVKQPLFKGLHVLTATRESSLPQNFSLKLLGHETNQGKNFPPFF